MTLRAFYATLTLTLLSITCVCAEPNITQRILALESKHALGALGNDLGSSNEAVAASAALAIGRTRDRNGIVILRSHMNDTRVSVRALSVYALGLLGDCADQQAIAGAVTDSSGAVRIAAIDALERCSAQSDTIENALARDVDPIVRGKAAIALYAFGDDAHAQDAADALVAAVRNDRSDLVRERAMWAIFRSFAKRVPRAFLSQCVSDSDEVVRIEAVRAYGKLGDSSAAKDLSAALNDPSWRVQEQAMESIRVLGGGTMTEHLTAIAPNVHLPPMRIDPYAKIAALPRRAHRGAPTVGDAPAGPTLLPKTAADMTSPAPGMHPQVRIVTTKGNVYLTLYPEWAPLTVENFLNLSANGFYDNNPWFRIVPDFVVQTGEKDAVKAPGPGYAIRAEQNPLEQSSYVISMGLDYDGNSPKLDSAGSEYYITLSPQYHLDQAFTVFGAVRSGEWVLAHLTESDKVLRIERLPDAPLERAL